MSVSTDAVLAYGYNLGGDEHGWKVEGVDRWQTWVPPWLDTEDLGDDLTGDLVMEECRRQLEASDLSPDMLVPYCSMGTPAWLLSACTYEVPRGPALQLTIHELALPGKQQDVLVDRLASALSALDLRPTGPCTWHLASSTDLY